ncbi:hypothetical protein KAR52_00050 [Candidatus Pacearchaeota archaeon]|nr:hypothetical protein [Candidatus Pacearchaeota archaeon]MCK5150039.1 hypothetical protein [Candidatus Pacearchaeota archaeon]
MLKDFLKEVVVIVAGKQAEEIAGLLDNKKHVNEFLIAKKMEITINQTRNILYKISDHGLVSFIRKKDKKKGWYTYFWKIEVLKSLEFLKEILVKNINQIEHQIKSREAKRFYICERCNIEFNEENALLHNFTCDDCGDLFVIKDNSKVLRDFDRNLNKLKKELELVEKDIQEEQEKIDKKKEREFKKEQKEKAEAKKKAKEKLVKKTPKKSVVKKEKTKKTLRKKATKKKLVKKTSNKKKTKSVKKKK